MCLGVSLTHSGVLFDPDEEAKGSKLGTPRQFMAPPSLASGDTRCAPLQHVRLPHCWGAILS